MPDEVGRILHTAEMVNRRFGGTREELIGQTVLMLYQHNWDTHRSLS